MKRRPPRSTRTNTPFPNTTLVRSPQERAAPAVRQPEDPPGGDRLAGPGAVPAGDDRQSGILQGLRGDVRVRHAVRLHGRRREAAEVGLREVEGAAEGS